MIQLPEKYKTKFDDVEDSCELTEELEEETTEFNTNTRHWKKTH
jgi:hypothetical protein